MWPFSRRKIRSFRPTPRPSFRPRLEALEDRCVPSAGALDPTFGSGGIVTTVVSKYNDTSYGALLQPNGNIIAYGDAQTSSQGVVVDNFTLARYTPAGMADTTFGSGGVAITNFGGRTSDYIEQAALQADGKIVAAGVYKHLARYNSNGALDTTFGSGGLVTYPANWYLTHNALLIQPSDGDIVVGGAANVNGQQVGALLRYTPNGALDTSFGSGGELLITAPNATVVVNALAMENGGLVVGGWDLVSSSATQWTLYRYTLGGSPDPTFGSGGVVTTVVGAAGGGHSLQSLLVQPDGRILAVGVAPNSAGQHVWALARYNVDGSLDASFGSGGAVTSSITGDDIARGSALQSNGQIVVTGSSNGGAYSPTGMLEVGVYNADGSPDVSFGSGGFVTQAVASGAQGMRVVVQSDGKIVAAGTALVNGKDDFLLARFGASAAQIGSFTAGANPVASGGSETLTASNITPADPSSTIAQVAFYYIDATGAKQVLGYGTQTSPGVWTLTFTVNLAPGTYTLYAQATDSDGVLGDPMALTLQVM